MLLLLTPNKILKKTEMLLLLTPNEILLALPFRTPSHLAFFKIYNFCTLLNR